MTEDPLPRIVIAGGGVAAVEAALALRELSGGRIALTIVTPAASSTLRSYAVAASFAAGHTRRIAIDDLAAELSARLVDGVVEEVRPDEHEMALTSGEVLSYDALVVAVGAVPQPGYPCAQTFVGTEHSAALGGLVADMEEGYCRRLAVVVPPGVCWTLPAYELALLTARDVTSMGIDDAEITIVSPEARPLALFGGPASEAVMALLTDAGIRWEGNAYAQIPSTGRIVLTPGDRELHVDRIVALAVWEGHRVGGLPQDDDGFIPVDDHGRVHGVVDVFAAGDVTDFPIKQGGIACQQADAVADAIAATYLETAGPPVPFRPVLRGHLLTGRGSGPFLWHTVAGGDGEGVVSESPLWWPPTKIAGRHLGPWLARQEQQEHPVPDASTVPIETELPSERSRAAAMALDPLGPLPRTSFGRG